VLATCCGVPYIDAPYEADTQLACLSKNNLIDGIITNDYDILTFGGKIMIMDFWNCTKKNLNGKIIKEINLKKFLKNIKMNYDQFVELCVLMGSDYSEKPKYTFEYIYEVLINNGLYKSNLDKFKNIPPNFDFDKITNYFKDSQSTCTKYTKELYEEIINKFSYDKDKIKTFLLEKKKIIISDKYIDKFINNIIKYDNLSKIKKK
jgi:5'-3' exonuclease